MVIIVENTAVAEIPGFVNNTRIGFSREQKFEKRGFLRPAIREFKRLRAGHGKGRKIKKKT